MTSTATRTSKKDLVNNFARLCGTFLCRNCTPTTKNCLFSRFLEYVNKRRRISLSLFIFLRNSTPGWFAYIYKQSKPVGIIAMKFQRTRSHFLVVTFSPPLPSWYVKLSDDLVTNLQCLYVFMTCFKTSFSLMAQKKITSVKLNKFVYFVTLYCNNFSSSFCVSCIDLSSCSFPLLNFFLD